MSLLTIAQNLCDVLGLERPSTMSGNVGPQFNQIRAIINQAAADVFQRHDWNALASIVQYQTVAGERQPEMIPADYDRMAAGQTLWDDTRDEPIQGPVSPSDWAGLQQPTGAFFNQFWRFLGRDVGLFRAPPAGQRLTFEYLTKNHVQAANGERKATYSDDADTSVLPEDLITLAAIWRWRNAKGFSYAEEMASYERELERLSANDAASPILTLSRLRFGFPEPYPSSPAPAGPFISSSSLKSSAI